MRQRLPRLALLLLITVTGGWLVYWLSFATPSSRAGRIGAGIGSFVWIMVVLAAFGRPIVRALRILLGWSEGPSD